MKAVILYDLAAPVEMSREDAEVVALVNRGHSAYLEDKVIIQEGVDLYLVKRPRSIATRLRTILSALLVILSGVAALALLLGELMVLLLPFKFPMPLVMLAWSVFIFGLLLADRFKK